MSRTASGFSLRHLLLAGYRLLRDDVTRLVGIAAMLRAGLTLTWAVPHAGIPLPGDFFTWVFHVAETSAFVVPFVPVDAAAAVVAGLYGLLLTFVTDPIAALSWRLLPFLWGLLLFGVHLFAAPFIWAAVVATAGDVHSGRRASVWESLRLGWRIMLPLVRTSMLFCVGLALYAILVTALLFPSHSLPLSGSWGVQWQLHMLAADVLAICGALGTLPFVIMLPVMVFEQRFGWDAFRISYTLMRSNLVRGGSAVIASMLLAETLSEALGFAVSHGVFGGRILALMGGAVSTAYASCVLVVLYRVTRGGREEVVSYVAP